MESIKISFIPSSLGRIDIDADVMTSDRKSFEQIQFKVDTGSEFTTLSIKDLYDLGYNEEFLISCKEHHLLPIPAFGKIGQTFKYIEHVSLKFGDRELQNCRVFFTLGTKLKSLLGSDLTKYFNVYIDNDRGVLTLNKRQKEPGLSSGEERIQIYSLSNLKKKDEKKRRGVVNPLHYF